MIRTLLGTALLIAAGQARAGMDVPPPRTIHAVQPLLTMAATSSIRAVRGGRGLPSTTGRWLEDRFVPVAGFDRITACEARARIGAIAADDGWADDREEPGRSDEGDDFADAEIADGLFPAWEN